VGRMMAYLFVLLLVATPVCATDEYESEGFKLVQAAEAGDAEAQFKLGVIYHRNKAYAEACKWWGKAALQNHANAQIMLGIAYHNGEGVPQNYVNAIDLYRLAERSGNEKTKAVARYQLSIMYLKGEGVGKDVFESVRLLKLALDGGISEPDAKMRMALHYRHGYGLAKSDTEAFRWFLKAAQQGHPAAQYEVGQCYKNGIGVRANKKETEAWLSKAAQQGHIAATFTTPVNAQSFKKGQVIESRDEISCSSFGDIQFAVKGMHKFQGQQYGAAAFKGWISNADCRNLPEGMTLKVLKTQPFDSTYVGKTKGVLVKLPTGMTTWVAR